MPNILMVIIVCGTSVGNGCHVESSWVNAQMCKNAQETIKNPWYGSTVVYCISSNEENK